MENLQAKLRQSKLLRQEMESLQAELQQSKLLQKETEALLTEKAKEKVLAEVEKIKEELTLKDEGIAKEKEAFKNDAAQSYLVGFDEAVEQASGLHPEINFSQLGLGKTVINRQLVEE